jgi:ATP-dependent helicase YprA (DUF1998 family)
MPCERSRPSVQPFLTAEHVKDAYRRYVQTSFPIRRPELRARFERLIEEEKLLWQDPFVSLSRPFEKGAKLAELVAERVLGEGVSAGHWGFEDLYRHQVDAIRRLSTLQGRAKNTIVATGTGSGKTESFLIPIVDDCLRNPEPAGVRAVILYPMNALANDQLKRLRVQLAGTGVSFGRYTGDTPYDERTSQEEKRFLPRPAEAPEEERYFRKEIQDRPPHILITNYTMLELLLLRKEEQRIFKGVKPRYLVLDEVHTYKGILGTEVACLVRRFKEHAGLSAGELACVGTSATVKSGEAETDERARLVEFATELFGEEFGLDAIVDERYQALPERGSKPYTSPRSIDSALLEDFDPEKPEAVRELFRAWSGSPLAERDASTHEDLYAALDGRPEFLDLERILQSPRGLSDVLAAARAWPGRVGLEESALRNEVAAVFLLGCSAQAPGSEEPLFRPRVHLLIRSLSPLNVCVACDALLTDGRTECAGHEHAGFRRALGLGVCRSCGQDYSLGSFVPGEDGDRPVDRPGRVVLSAGESEDRDSSILYLLSADVELPPADEDDGRPATRRYGVCPRCSIAIPLDDDGDPRCCDNASCEGERLRPFTAFLRGATCPVCRGQGHGRRPQIITPMRTGAASSVSVLTQSLFPKLKPPSDGGLDEKKVLVFADSRQDTAHQAGYLRDRHQAFTQRQLLFRFLRAMQEKGQPEVSLADDAGHAVLAREMFLHVRGEHGEVEAMNFLTPVDARSADDAGFYEPGRVISRAEQDRAVERLRWDVALEFTIRATQRNSLEREGLVAVQYASLVESAREFAAVDGGALGPPERCEAVLRALLDYFRINRAVDYEPFRDYLGSQSDAVVRRIARPTPQTRTPIGVDREKRARKGAFEVKGLYNAAQPGRYQTAVFNLVQRSCPRLDEHEIVALIDRKVAFLERKGYLRKTEIGQRSQRFGRLTTNALQLRERMIEVHAGGDRFRCDACGRMYGYRISSGVGEGGVCAAHRCKGSVVPYHPDAETNFYVRFYASEQPERLYAMEHSGQLSGEERVILEEKFRQGRVNALVCTPTLELGVNIGDLVALVLRNVPPTPSNYAQRAGRAGRAKRIALVLTHAGRGPHDAYFFQNPADMISGAIRPPTFLLDNRVVIDRHLNSLILAKLATKLPGTMAEVRTEEGVLREDLPRRFAEELVGRLGEVQASVARAFVREKKLGGLAWLDDGYVRSRIDSFPGELRAGLEHWCRRFREVYGELARLASKVRKNEGELASQRRLNEALDTLEKDQRYYPLSYLAQVGFLPRYGFPGDMVTVRDRKEREISQAAAVGIAEYAPGNIVYVGGRKLRVDRILFSGAAREDPRENARGYRYCPTCHFVTERPLDAVCEHCHGDLKSGRCVDYREARGGEGDFIGQDDEYRDRSSYELERYLRPESEVPEGSFAASVLGWSLRYSRLRTVEIYNRGARQADGRIEPFLVCLECGAWRQREDHGDSESSWGNRHLPMCSVTAWNPEDDDRVERLHLRATLQGDVVEIGLPAAVASEERWTRTFDQALRLGLQLELFVGSGEVDSFCRSVTEEGRERRSLVLYDTMPGGTGYLRRLVAELPRIAGRALHHLETCTCESACYRCLKDFWNQRYHELLDKRLVLTALRALTVPADTPAAKVDADVRFESFLEARFYELLQEAGLRLPKTQRIVRNADGRWIARADFTFEHPPLAVFTDGRQFHATLAGQVVADLEKRNELELSGTRVLEFTYGEVVERPDSVIEALRRSLGRAEGAGRAAELVARTPTEAEVLLASATGAHAGTSRTGGTLLLEGERVPTALCDERTRTAVLLVDADSWLRSRATWESALRAHTRLRAAGWRLYRVPFCALDESMLGAWAAGASRLLGLHPQGQRV